MKATQQLKEIGLRPRVVDDGKQDTKKKITEILRPFLLACGLLRAVHNEHSGGPAPIAASRRAHLDSVSSYFCSFLSSCQFSEFYELAKALLVVRHPVVPFYLLVSYSSIKSRRGLERFSQSILLSL